MRLLISGLSKIRAVSLLFVPDLIGARFVPEPEQPKPEEVRGSELVHVSPSCRPVSPLLCRRGTRCCKSFWQTSVLLDPRLGPRS